MEGKTTLHIFKENLSGLLYKKIIIRKLLPSMRRLYRGDSWILVQDNDPKITCKKVSDYLKKKADVKVWPDWPAAFPDINPIENIWGIMKKVR